MKIDKELLFNIINDLAEYHCNEYNCSLCKYGIGWDCKLIQLRDNLNKR